MAYPWTAIYRTYMNALGFRVTGSSHYCFSLTPPHHRCMAIHGSGQTSQKCPPPGTRLRTLCSAGRGRRVAMGLHRVTQFATHCTHKKTLAAAWSWGQQLRVMNCYMVLQPTLGCSPSANSKSPPVIPPETREHTKQNIQFKDLSRSSI